MRSHDSLVFASLVLALAACSHDTPKARTAGTAQTDAARPSNVRARPAWMDRSDANAKLLVDVLAPLDPESASRLGVESADPYVEDVRPGFRDRWIKAMDDVSAELESRRAKETDPRVLEDLAILLHSAAQTKRETEVTARTVVPFRQPAKMVFNGMQALLDEQIAPARRAKAIERLNRFAGITPGTTPMTELVQMDIRASKAPVYPLRQDVEKALANSAVMLQGTKDLVETYKVPGAGPALAALQTQLAAYDAFVRAEILPRARTTAPLPPELYDVQLNNYGVDLPAAQVAAMAHQEFAAIVEQMKPIAASIAQAKNLPASDWKSVFLTLKKDQIVGDAIMPHYRARLGQIEDIVRKNNLLTLPDRPAKMRLASAAESAQAPAPYMMPPRLLGNTGEEGVFVLPLSGGNQPYDDFTYAAASWTLTAHELRPGHELQFDSMVERGVTLARGDFAFNSVNAEGWALYSEAMILPYMPPEGQLASLQFRLLRAARAFLDPELQMSKWTSDSAREFLQNEVGLSPAFARAEVERYTFDSPGQATSYFYGYVRLRALRAEVETKLGTSFDVKKFHDAILEQGLLPPDLMRQAVLESLGAPLAR